MEQKELRDIFMTPYIEKEIFCGTPVGLKEFAGYFDISNLRGSIENNAIPNSHLQIFDDRGRIVQFSSAKYPCRLGELLFDLGHSAVLHRPGDIFPSVAKLLDQFRIWTGRMVFINAYYTPPRSQIFKRHVDEHDVLVLQLDGKKEWHIFESNDARKIILTEGQILNIPAGIPHFAKTGNEVSFHLSVGIAIDNREV